jgi:hypothetical protein
MEFHENLTFDWKNVSMSSMIAMESLRTLEISKTVLPGRRRFLHKL